MNKKHHISIPTDKHKKYKEQNILISLYDSLEKSNQESLSSLEVSHKDLFPYKDMGDIYNNISADDTKNIISYFEFGHIPSDLTKSPYAIVKSGEVNWLQIDDMNITLSDASPVGRNFVQAKISFIANSFPDLISSGITKIFQGEKAFLRIQNWFTGDKSPRQLAYANLSKVELELNYVKHLLDYYPPNADGNPRRGRESVVISVDFIGEINSHFSDQDRAKFIPAISSGNAKDIEKKEKKRHFFQNILDQLDKKGKLKKIGIKTDNIKSFGIGENNEKQTNNLLIYTKDLADLKDSDYILEYYYFGEIIEYINSYWKNYFDSKDDIHDLFACLGDVDIPTSIKISESSRSAETNEDFANSKFLISEEFAEYLKNVQIEETDNQTSIEVYPEFYRLKDKKLSNFPISKSFIRAKLLEIDNKKKEEKGVSGKDFMTEMTKMVTQALYSYMSEQRDISELLSIEKYYSTRSSKIFATMLGIASEQRPNESILKRRERYIFQSLPRKDKQNILYIYGKVDPDAFHEFDFKNYDESSTIVDLAKFSPLDDAALHTIALVNANNSKKNQIGKDRSNQNLGALKYSRTVYSIELVVKCLNFITPGSIIKMSRNTLVSQNTLGAPELDEFLGLLTNKMLVTKVEHIKKGKAIGDHFQTKIIAQPLFVFGDES